VGFVVDKVALGHVFCQYFGFLSQLFHRLLPTHHPSSGAGTTGKRVTDMPSGPSLNPPQETKKETTNLTYSMELNPSEETAICEAAKELPSIL
jgi:hypothetical protein